MRHKRARMSANKPKRVRTKAERAQTNPNKHDQVAGTGTNEDDGSGNNNNSGSENDGGGDNNNTDSSSRSCITTIGGGRGGRAGVAAGMAGATRMVGATNNSQ